METTTRAALGSCAALGDLYDARRDDFCGMSIFKKSIPNAAIYHRDTPSSDVTLLHSDDYSAKCNKLEVNAELQVSVLGGLFQLEGSGNYLNDQKKSARTVKSSLIYTIKIREDLIEMYHAELKDAFSIDAIQTGVATHVVVGISWGANTILTCQFENQENRDVSEISGKLAAHMDKMSLSINRQAGVDFKDDDASTGINVRMFGDIVAANEELPGTAEAALQLMKEMPSLVSSSNNGKGMPLSYRLMPIKTLKSYLDFTFKIEVPIVRIESLDGSILTRVVQIFNQIAIDKQKLHDFHQDAVEFNYCIPPGDYQRVMDLKGKIELEESKFRIELATVLAEVRSGNSDAAKIEELLQKFQQNDMSPHKVSIILSTWSSLIEKLNFARTLVQNGVKYIGTGVSLDEELRKVHNEKVFVLYFSQSSAKEDPDRWQSSKQLFIGKAKEKLEGNKYFVVDCDIHPNLKKSDQMSFVEVHEKGQVRLLDEGKLLITSSPIVRSTSSEEMTLYKPNKRVPLIIACTGGTCDPSAVYEWKCYKCKQSVEYGFDQFIYCSCGKTATSSLEFRCTDPKHGPTFKKHEAVDLRKLLDALRVTKEMNILILGETGVGKSTWINSFVNCHSYNTLDEAANGELITMIPTSFTVMDEKYEEVVVRAGVHDANEVQAAGQSATQSSKVYSFRVGDTTVQLIDTPGIGDTRGIEQDTKNFENILDTLSYFDEIHSICILLKPNNSRLSVTFRFCIKELLTYLHKDASQNIVFCFTNSRGTFFKPGDTLPALRKLLSENQNVNLSLSKNTVYCFDSESYRFLAALKNNPPVVFSDSERRDFSFSWEKSMEETKRMIEYIRTLAPHKINGTLNLNFARKLVAQLSRPLAEITTIIQRNKAVVLEELDEIRGMAENIAELTKRKTMRRMELKNTRINFPKTVCEHRDCVQIRRLENGPEIVEKLICHSPCYVQGVGQDVIGDYKLSNCQIMDSRGKCRVCSHTYKHHGHFWYDSALVEVEVEDQAVVNSLKKNETAAEIKRAKIRDLERELGEYGSELKEIEKALVRFAYFLKTNAITPYSDVLEEFLQHQIREEQDMLAVFKDRRRATLEGLEQILASYRREKGIFESQMQDGKSAEQPPTRDDVNRLILKLQELKHSGKALKDALDAVQFMKKVIYNKVPQNTGTQRTFN